MYNVVSLVAEINYWSLDCLPVIERTLMSEYNLRILDFMHSRGLKNGSRPVGFRGKVYKVAQKLKPFSNAECIIGMFYWMHVCS